jgi:hypothetical protein
MKDKRTTIVAIFGGAILLSLTAGLILGKLDASEYAAACGAVGLFLSTLLGFFAADSKRAV